MVAVQVVVNHSDYYSAASAPVTIELSEDGSETIFELKEKVGKAVDRPAEKIHLQWMDKTVGKINLGDTKVDEAAVKIDKYNIAMWVQKFPHFHLICKGLPETPMSAADAIKVAVENQAKSNAK